MTRYRFRTVAFLMLACIVGNLQGQSAAELQKKIQDLVQAGAAAFNAGRYAEARNDFEQAAALAPDNDNALAYGGLSWLRDNPTDPSSVQKVVDLSNAAIAKNPDNWLAHRTLGEVYDSRKLSDQAMKEYGTAARLNPNDADTLYALGKLQYRARLFSDAQTSFEKCVALRPDFTSAHFNRGMSLLQLGDKAKALDAFKASVATRKDFPDGWYMVGYLQRDRGDTAAALEAFKLAVQYAPTNAGYHRELGSAYIARNDFESAESALSKALALEPDNAVANFNMASVKIKLNKPREALPYAQKAVDRDNGSAASTYILGVANDKLGNSDDALRYYSTAVQKDPKFAPALINLGGLYDARGLPDKALPLLQTALEIAPDSWEAHNNLGMLYLHQQKYQDSITQLTKALSIQPDAHVAQYNLGLAYYMLGSLLRKNGDIAGAVDSFKLALHYAPDNADFARELSAAETATITTSKSLNEQVLKKQSPQQPAASLDLKELSFEDIYPVFHNYYDTHPLGRVTLSNASGQPITGIKVSFQIKEFMTDPKDCPTPLELGPGESKSVDLFGLFLPTIMETTEKTKAQARVDVEYTLNGQIQHQSLVQSIPILDRNATTWTDDRRAAAFVTTKDPAVLTFSKNVSSMVKGKIQGAVNSNLLTAIALFQALQLFGLTYSQDPIPTLTANKQVADYIQFPRQTLQYKGGKCSDFSVLYSALLESVGIETAFITIPGHIFVAFSTGVSLDETRKAFSRAEDLIFRDEKSWIPVEVTESAGFLRAWQDGARQWRENLSRNQVDFYPLHDVWQLYEPVGLPGAEVMVNLPPSEKVVSAYQEEVGKFVDREIFPRAAALQGQITKAQDPRKLINALGVLYARYGEYDRAQKEFKKLLAKEEYVPALLNTGNILYLSDQKEKALDYYDRAYAKDPANPRALLAVAMVNHDLENYFAAKKFYALLKARDPDLALQYAYLEMKGEEATRAAEVSGMGGTVVWEE